MATKLMYYLRRRWFVLVLLAIALGALIWVFIERSDSTQRGAVPPAQIIMGQAILIDQGVEVNWLAALPGMYPITGYLIERSRDGENFIRIARVEKTSLSFLDTEGQKGDAYRIIAEDDRRPAGHSAASIPVAASAPKPGSVVVVESSISRYVLGVAKPTGRQTGPDETAATLQEHMIQLFAALDPDLARNDFTAVSGYLTALQNDQRQILSLWQQLSAVQKVASAHACEEQAKLFGANLHVLPERSQLDGMLVQAGCSAMQESL